jgi:hypothetical protein
VDAAAEVRRAAVDGGRNWKHPGVMQGESWGGPHGLGWGPSDGEGCNGERPALRDAGRGYAEGLLWFIDGPLAHAAW